MVSVHDIDLKNAVRYRSEKAKILKMRLLIISTFGSFMEIISVVPIEVYVLCRAEDGIIRISSN